MNITVLGPANFNSPIKYEVDDKVRIPAQIERFGKASGEDVLFEQAGPRRKLFFDAATVRAGIVTCGGLCPGMNTVIRSLFFQLYHAYGVRTILGFPGGYLGLDPSSGTKPILLDPDMVDHIHQQGGTILRTSRGPVDTNVAVDYLVSLGINMLFTIGGDGTQRGAKEIFDEAKKRNYPMAVVGIPKTIDNDVAWVSRSFGFQTAVEESIRVINCAHTESKSVKNGISIVKLMGRDAGFIAACATVASQDVNFTLIPEIPLTLGGSGGFLEILKNRILSRAHAVIVVAEGAGQQLLTGIPQQYDASGNLKPGDIGTFLREKITKYFKEQKIEATARYFDPSYAIRSVPADAEDSILCDQYARHAVHAAMAGKTGMIIGLLHDRFIHVPIEMTAHHKKRIEPDSFLWHSVLAATGQPGVWG